MSSADELPDAVAGAPHPRKRSNFLVHMAAERAFLEAILAGRLHHAWIIAGPEGVGKSTLAYRVARFLLANPNRGGQGDGAHADLSVAQAHPAFHRIAAGAHPNLFVLRREPDPKSGKITSVIPVEAARRAVDFFSATAAEPGWRICIVDAADDLNAASANALLKLIEEPPTRALFLIVSHMPGRLLATIRSRCRMIILKSLPIEALEKLALEAELERSAFEPILHVANGSARRLFALASGDGGETRAAVGAALAALPNIDHGQLLTLADKLSGAQNDDAFDGAMEAVQTWLSDRLHARAHLPARDLASMAELWNKLAASRSDLEAYNLDRRPYVVSMFQELSGIARART